MKLIKRKADNSVVILVEDNCSIEFNEDHAMVENVYYCDVILENFDLVENCGLPEDTLTDADGNPLTFWGNKFIYTDAWALNPDWVEPEVLVEEPVAEPIA